VSPAPAVLVEDQFGNPTPGISVTFAIAQGGGLLTGETQVTDASGIATVGSWILGTGGANELTATVTGSGIGGNPASFNFTSSPPGAPASVAGVDGGNQTGLVGVPLNVAPAVIVRDASSNPVQGVQVDFQITMGTGSLTGATVLTDLTGVARVGGWSVSAGANQLSATAAGVGAPAMINASGVASSFNVEVRFLTAVTPSQMTAFTDAAARWGQIIFGDLTNVTLNPTQAPAGSCQTPSFPAINETIDDVVIFALVEPIDGPGMVLGRAGPCFIRLSNAATVVGVMRFDSADLATMETQGTLGEVILHEMGHVFGLGTLWNLTQPIVRNLLTGAGGADPRFVGAEAESAFDRVGGTNFPGAGVPVENQGGPGTRDGHWRESLFVTELMTGIITSPGNPFSIVTAASYMDLGYTVALGAADAYMLPNPPLMAATGEAQQGLRLVDDIHRAPIVVVDANGRVVGVLPVR
jgi:hypothetical protein